jgi:signal peptidase I
VRSDDIYMTDTLARSAERLEESSGGALNDPLDQFKVTVPVLAPATVPRRPWHAIKRVLSVTMGVILAVVAVIAIFLAVSTHFSPKGQVAVLGHPVMSVLSGSMAPTINTGDMVIDNKVTPAQAANLHVGQIISFRAGAGSSVIFTHRIAAVVTIPGGGVGYVTKGDANDSRDGPITPPSYVVGTYQSRIPNGGYILNDLHQPIVLGLLLASALLWLASAPLWRWVRQEDEPSAA